MLINRLYEFGKGLAVWDQKFRLKLNENFGRCLVGAKGGPGIKVEIQKGEALISLDDAELAAEDEDAIPPAPSMYPVRVQKDGGADGGTASVATWTYTLRDASSFATIITSATQNMPRPYGAMTYQPGSTGFGVAFLLGGTVFLWNAGEVPTIVVCGTAA